MDSTQRQIHKLIADLLEKKDFTEEFSDDMPLVTSGHLDSLDIMDIVVYLEQEFELDFAERGIDQTDFDTVKSIVNLVQELS